MVVSTIADKCSLTVSYFKKGGAGLVGGALNGIILKCSKCHVAI